MYCYSTSREKRAKREELLDETPVRGASTTRWHEHICVCEIDHLECLVFIINIELCPPPRPLTIICKRTYVVPNPTIYLRLHHSKHGRSSSSTRSTDSRPSFRGNKQQIARQSCTSRRYRHRSRSSKSSNISRVSIVSFQRSSIPFIPP